MRVLLAIVTALFTLALPTAHAQAPSAGQQVEQKLQLPGSQTIPYLIYLPFNYGAEEKKWPLLLFLHGRGESYGPLSLVKKWGPPRLVELGVQLPYIIVSPQCPGDSSWAKPEQQSALISLLDHVVQTYRVDEDRILLSGLSMGGYGSWRLAADRPERFAAVVPICGGGSPADADKLKWLPIWVFHGTEDKAVPLQRSVEMVEAIRNAGSKTIRFTTLEGIGHNSWEAAYASPDLYQWMETQAASKNHARAQEAGQ